MQAEAAATHIMVAPAAPEAPVEAEPDQGLVSEPRGPTALAEAAGQVMDRFAGIRSMQAEAAVRAS